MGLGKTLQVLYFIEWHSQNYNENKPYLIVAPVSLLENWKREYQRFFPNTTISMEEVYANNNTESLVKTENDLVKNKNNIITKFQNKKILLTTYETLSSYQISFGIIEFSIVILDEAQYVKTPGTKRTRASKSLQSKFKLAMTGTPVENTYMDIWCIMDFIRPGLLGNFKKFSTGISKSTKKRNNKYRRIRRTIKETNRCFYKKTFKNRCGKRSS